MDIVIIEDEKLVANDLAHILSGMDKNIHIKKILFSVNEAMLYFREHPLPHVIFSDIQLGDGYSFEIFREIPQQIPIVYCTAYDQHALKAFQHNGIAYILKPYTAADIKEALDKCRHFQYSLTATKQHYEDMPDNLLQHSSQQTTILVNYKDKIIPVRMDDIAFFFIQNGCVHLLTFNMQAYQVSYTLDDLEEISGVMFFRANRQCILNKKAVKEVTHYSYRKLFISLNIETGYEIIIGKNRISEFLHWLQK